MNLERGKGDTKHRKPPKTARICYPGAGSSRFALAG